MDTEAKNESGQFQNWYRKHYDSLFKFGQTKLDDEEQLKDLIQETFLVAFEKKDAFKQKSNEKTWLIGILKRKIYLFYRKQNMKKKFVGEQIDLYTFQQAIRENFSRAFTEPAENTTDVDFFNKAAELIEDALLSLPDTTRDIFVKLYFEKKTVGNVCDELKISPSNCYVICYRGKDLLRKYFVEKMKSDH